MLALVSGREKGVPATGKVLQPAALHILRENWLHLAFISEHSKGVPWASTYNVILTTLRNMFISCRAFLHHRQLLEQHFPCCRPCHLLGTGKPSGFVMVCNGQSCWVHLPHWWSHSHHRWGTLHGSHASARAAVIKSPQEPLGALQRPLDITFPWGPTPAWWGRGN